MNQGDRVRFGFNDSEPVSFHVYAPSKTAPQGTFESIGIPIFQRKDGVKVDLGMEVYERGEYLFFFEAEPETYTRVVFYCRKDQVNTKYLIFTEKGSHSGPFGGMGSVRLYPCPLPSKIVIGRTWSDSGAWTDHSYSYETELSVGESINVRYNATEPIHFSYLDERGEIESLKACSYETVYGVKNYGTHRFNFWIEEPRTAIVSFICNKVRKSSLIVGGKNDLPVIFFSPLERRRAHPRFPPKFNSTLIQGKLNVSLFPVREKDILNGEVKTVDREVLLIDHFDGNESQTYYLHLGVDPEMVVYPKGGYTKRGRLTLFDMVEACKGGIPVEVVGFPFRLKRNYTIYNMFHVNSMSTIDPTELPLYAHHDWSIVAGRNTYYHDDEAPLYFPASFRLGVDQYEEFGNIEHFYHIYLHEGEAVRFTFNISAPIEFGLYCEKHPTDVPTIQPFSFGRPEDYLIRESQVEFHREEFMANRTGYYTFDFKAYSGKRTVAHFDCVRIQ